MAGRTGFFHHIGTFLLLAATVLLIITCISAPVVNNISLMKVEIGNRFDSGSDSSIAFGTFGWCVNREGDDICTDSHVGYQPSDALDVAGTPTSFSDYAYDTTRALTKAMVLHPIACGLNFIAFILALGAGFVGSFLASLVALLAFLVTCAIMIIDFVLFAIIRSNVNDNGTDSRAEYGAAAWTTLVSAICSLLGTLVLFFTCCSARMHRRRAAVAPKNDYGAPVAQPVRTRRRWF